MKTKIIAELAQGYEGKEELAYLLVKAACKTDADAVKLQCIYADEVAVPDYKHYKLFKQLEMPLYVWNNIANIIHNSGKEFYLDIFGNESLEMATRSNIDGVKLHSTDFFNTRLVEKAINNFSKIFVSVGGINVNEIENFISRYKVVIDRFFLVFGFQSEPTPLKYNNIFRLGVLRKRFPEVKFGFMDHSDADMDEALTLSLLTLPFEIDYIEKHMTLDPLLKLEDYVSALTPSEFQEFIGIIRKHEIAMGTKDVSLSIDELKYRNDIIKIVVANKDIVKGRVIDDADIALKRTNTSNDLCYFHKSDVVGRKVAVDINANSPIKKEMVI